MEQLHNSQQAQEAELKKIVEMAFERFTAEVQSLRNEIRANRGEFFETQTESQDLMDDFTRQRHAPPPVAPLVRSISSSSMSPWERSEDQPARDRDSFMSDASLAEPSEIGPAASPEAESFHAERFIAKEQSSMVFGDDNESFTNHRTSHSSLAKMEGASQEMLQMKQDIPWSILLPNSRFRLVWDVVTCLLSARQTAQLPKHAPSLCSCSLCECVCARQFRSLPSLCHIGSRSYMGGAWAG